MNAHFTRLFTYNDWANRRLLVVLRGLETWPPQTARRMSHILEAQQLWYARMMEEDQPVDLFPEYTIDELEALNVESTRRWLDLTARMAPEDRTKVVRYKTTSGTAHESLVIDVLTQVINHATHHRGQIIAALRDAGHEPPKTDFIFFAREPATVG